MRRGWMLLTACLTLAAGSLFPAERPSLAKPFAEAAKDFKKGNYAEAARFYREIMVTYEGSDWEAKAGLYLGQCFEAQGKRGQAEDAYRKVAEKHFQSAEGAESAFRLAGMAETIGDVKGAEGWYEKLAASGTQGREGALALLNLANLQARSKRPQDALKAFSRLAAEYPDNAWALREAQMGRAKVFRGAGEFSEALSVYQSAADKSPAGPAKAQILMSLGHCALEAKDNTRATAAYQQVSREYLELEAPALYYLALSLKRSGKLKEAMDTCERLEVKHPKTVWAQAAGKQREDWAADGQSSVPVKDTLPKD